MRTVSAFCGIDRDSSRTLGERHATLRDLLVRGGKIRAIASSTMAASEPASEPASEGGEAQPRVQRGQGLVGDTAVELGDGVVVPLGDVGVVLPVSGGLLDGCGLGAEPVGDSDAGVQGELLGASVPSVPAGAVDVPGEDGVGVAVVPDDPGVGVALVLLGMSG